LPIQQLLPLHQRMYMFIVTYIATHHGLSPSFKEIGEQCGLVSSGVEYHLLRLEKKGWIVRQPARHRSITLVGDCAPFEKEDIKPFLRDGRFEYTALPVHPLLPKRHVDGPIVAMKITGDDFLSDHICDGDLVVMSIQQTHRNGDILALNHVKDEQHILLKRFSQPDLESVQLSGLDPEEHHTITLSNELWEQEWRVLAVICTLYRTLE